MTKLMPSLCNDCVARNQCGNDDVKMCASYINETKIKCDDCKFVENCVDYGWQECKKFTQKPSEPMTNEEWFCQLTTEEKAKFLRQIYRDGRDDYVGEWYEQTEGDFAEWLKEMHHG